jgi:hypothetical protein
MFKTHDKRFDNHIFLPLQGPTGVRPKAPAVGAWQSPGYRGIDYLEASTRHRLSQDEWFGMRCDNLVVIDCDSKEAAERWCEIDVHATSGWVRKTPHGVHFVYLPSAGSPDWPSADVFGEGSHIDIRAGRTSQIVVCAPGYRNLTDAPPLCFSPSWLPAGFTERTLTASRPGHEGESWDEMPDGRGNNVMTAIAGAMRKQGMSATAIAKCLGAINRITMTTDPMPVEMVVEIAKSVSRYNARPDIDIEVEE